MSAVPFFIESKDVIPRPLGRLSLPQGEGCRACTAVLPYIENGRNKSYADSSARIA